MSGNEGEINTSERRAEDRPAQEQGQQFEGPGGPFSGARLTRGIEEVNQMKSRIDDAVGKQAHDGGSTLKELIDPGIRRRIQAELMHNRAVERRTGKLSVLLVLIERNPEVVDIISLMQELGFIR